MEEVELTEIKEKIGEYQENNLINSNDISTLAHMIEATHMTTVHAKRLLGGNSDPTFSRDRFESAEKSENGTLFGAMEHSCSKEEMSAIGSKDRIQSVCRGSNHG